MRPAFVAALLTATPAYALELGPPLNCPPATACYVQNLPDLDPGPGQKDPACGSRTYDGHDGVDFRVRAAAMRTGVEVLAPVSGTVRGARDGEPDGALRSGGKAAVAGKECGNGVVIATPAGEVQLCHLKQGSVRVRPGQSVQAGEPVGLVGQSGDAAFPHLHVSVRRGAIKLDPGAGQPIAGASCTAGAKTAGFWSAAARTAMPFDTSTRIADWGFLDAAPASARDADLAPAHSGARTAPALVFYAMFGGPQAGDVLRMRLTGPDGSELAAADVAQERSQAQMARFIGKRTPPGGWPAGKYQAQAIILRGGREIDRRAETITLR